MSESGNPAADHGTPAETEGATATGEVTEATEATEATEVTGTADTAGTAEDPWDDDPLGAGPETALGW